MVEHTDPVQAQIGQIRQWFAAGTEPQTLNKNLTALGSPAVPAMMLVFADPTLDAGQRSLLQKTIEAFPDWREQMLKALKYGGLELSIAVARYGWGRSGVQMSRRERQAREQEQLKLGLQQENQRKFKEYVGKQVTLTLWEGMRRTGRLKTLSSSHLTLQVSMNLGGSHTNVDTQISFSEIKSIEPVE